MSRMISVYGTLYVLACTIIIKNIAKNLYFLYTTHRYYYNSEYKHKTKRFCLWIKGQGQRLLGAEVRWRCESHS